MSATFREVWGGHHSEKTAYWSKRAEAPDKRVYIFFDLFNTSKFLLPFEANQEGNWFDGNLLLWEYSDDVFIYNIILLELQLNFDFPLVKVKLEGVYAALNYFHARAHISF